MAEFAQVFLGELWNLPGRTKFEPKRPHASQYHPNDGLRRAISLACLQVRHAYSPKSQIATCTGSIEDRYGSIEADNRGGVTIKNPSRESGLTPFTDKRPGLEPGI